MQSPSNVVTPSTCVFCEIIERKAPGEILFENNEMLVIKDIKPASNFHYLAISRLHIKNIEYLNSKHKTLVEELRTNGLEVLEANGGDLTDVLLDFHVPPFNSVDHLHLHLISPQSEMSDLNKAIFQPHYLQFISPEAVLEKIGGTSK